MSQFISKESNSDFLYFELKTDIDLNSIEWKPMGTENSSFTGYFDGNDHIISNLKIHNEHLESIGLFGNAKDAIISNLTVINATIMGDKNVGGICGYANNCQIKNCKFQGILSSDTENCHLGGICGVDVNGKIINCQTSGEIQVSGMECEAGGIVGTSSGEIRKCENHSLITGVQMSRFIGASYLGGICGVMQTNLISQCKNYGNINSSSSTYYMAYLGGIASSTELGSIISGCCNS